MSNNNIATMINALQIPDTIDKSEYPRIPLIGADGNVFSLIGVAAKAWRPVDRGVSERIISVVNEHAEDYGQVLSLLVSISSSVDSEDEDESYE